MAQNFLYMFEFVVDEVLITRPNICAPEEYPTCCEISFRSSVFVSICDREYGQCPDPCNAKCGKCCLFSLESEVTDKDRLLVHVFKKKTENCKFFLGATDLPIKPMFDLVTENFNIENPNWEESLRSHLARLPNPRAKKQVAQDCDEDVEGRHEQLCPVSELTKRLLPLFNSKGVQTGNILLIMRLVCNGPAIVSSFPFSKFCATACKSGQQSCDICPPTPKPPCGPCVMPDPCKKVSKDEMNCHRYFACNQDKQCPCNTCEDEFDREVCEKNQKKKSKKNQARCDSCSPCRSCGGFCGQSNDAKTNGSKPQQCFGSDSSVRNCDCMDNNSDDCDADSYGEEQEKGDPCCPPKPCYIELSKPEPTPDAYEEFEACLHGSGLKIRVLKDTHQVSGVYDGHGGDLQDSEDECEKCTRETQGNRGPNMQDLLQGNDFVKNQIKRRTNGRIINHPKLPKIRANIKYSGADHCCPETYHVPFHKIKEMCDSPDRLDSYRVKGGCDHCGDMFPAQNLDTRGACVQIEADEIKNTLKGLNADARKRGIEVCNKTCDEIDSDVFLVRLGSKKRCEDKKNAIEIELKTPKTPVILPKQKITTETQITGPEIDAAIAGSCGGKKGKKGKGKKKGKK